MNFGFTEEQTMLGDSLARTLERGTDAAALFDLGAGAALMTEEAGGFGGTGADILMVFRTLGRAGAVTPLLDSVVLGAGILSAAGESDLAEAAASGEARVAVALDEPGQRYEGTVATTAAAAVTTAVSTTATTAAAAESTTTAAAATCTWLHWTSFIHNE